MDPFEEMLRATIDRLSYKDWTFRIEKDGIGLWFLQVRFQDEDVVTRAVKNHGSRKWRMSMHMTRSEIVQTALKAVLTAEEHEARERFLYVGRAIFGPHLNVDTLWELTERPDSIEKRS
jgi:hypothetical protein